MEKYKIGATVKQHINESQVREAFRHNERRNLLYGNDNIDLKLSKDNYYYIEPDEGVTYASIYKEKIMNSEISDKGLKKGKMAIDEIILEVKGEFFRNDRELAIKVYGKVVEELVNRIGKEYVLSAVLHCDEQYENELNGEKVIHYHVHIVFIPTHVKNKRYTIPAARKNPELYVYDENGKCVEENGKKLTKIKESYIQVSHSGFWKDKFGAYSYRALQDLVYEQAKEYGLNRGDKFDEDYRKEHVSSERYKANKLRANVEKLAEENDTLENENQMLYAQNEHLRESVEKHKKMLEKHKEDIKAQELKMQSINDAIEQLSGLYKRTKEEIKQFLVGIKPDKKGLVKIKDVDLVALKSMALKGEEGTKIIKEKNELLQKAKEEADEIIKEASVDAENYKIYEQFYRKVLSYTLEHMPKLYKVLRYIERAEVPTQGEINKIMDDNTTVGTKIMGDQTK